MANKISVIVDFVVDKATSSAKGFKQSINDAEGAVGKFKAGAKSSFDTIKAHAGQMAIAAGAAFVTMGAKAVGAFQDTALEAGHMRDALGLSAEEASRLAEVAGDIDVDVGALEKTIGRMNREAENTPSRFDEIGAAIVRNKDGTVNVNETFLATVDALNKMPDATKRAAAAQEIFGRSWMDISELVGMGAEDIRTALAEVSDAKIIDEGEIAKARATRAALDSLKDSVEDVALELGESLTPAVAVAAEMLAGVAPVAGKMAKFVGDSFVKIADQAYALGQTLADMADALPFVEVVGLAEGIEHTTYEFTQLERRVQDNIAAWQEGVPTMAAFVEKLRAMGLSQDEINVAMAASKFSLNQNKDAVEESTDATDELTEAVDRTKAGQEEAADMVDRVNATYNRQVEAADAAAEALAELTEEMIGQVATAFDLESSMLTLDSAYATYQESVMTTTALLQSSEATDREKEQALRDLRVQELGVAADALATAEAYATEMGAADGSAESAQLQKDKLYELAAAFPELRDEIQVYIDKLNQVPDVIRTRFEITATGATVTPHGDFIGIGGPRAHGGPTYAGRLHEVTENGSELLTEGGRTYLMAAANGHVTPANMTGWGSSPAVGAAGAGANVSIVVEGNIYGDKHLRSQLDTWARNVQRELNGAA